MTHLPPFGSFLDFYRTAVIRTPVHARPLKKIGVGIKVVVVVRSQFMCGIKMQDGSQV